jgi:hypothetical protein
VRIVFQEVRTMRKALLFLCGVLAATAVFGDTRVDVRDVVDHPFAADFAAGRRLRLHVRSGEIRIVGTDENRISVEVSGRNAREAGPVRVRLTDKNGDAVVRVTGGHKSDVVTTIRIPRRTELFARIPFGDVSIENVEGSKDVELHAGDMTIGVGNPADYAHVEASVNSGDLDGRPFGEEHSGLFRSFRKAGEGTYRLHAHVGAGDLILR